MDLFSPCQLGPIELSNRIVMAPMTRCRAVEGNVPSPLSITYYVQRAQAGLIITEGSQVSPLGVGFIRTPGIYSQEQASGWRKVTDAVHRARSKIFLQLWHVGRVSHSDLLGGQQPLAPSALPVEGYVHGPSGKKKIEIPRAIKIDEISSIIDQFRKGAKMAKEAGFDGVEIHGANGYLLDQFLRDSSNKRTDQYGGSLQNRARLPLAVAKAVVDVWGADRVGYRISPHFQMYSMSDSNPRETFSYLAGRLDDLGLLYLHMIERVGGLNQTAPEARLAPLIRNIFQRTLILNGGYDAKSGNQAIATGASDLISYGSLFLANPDLPERFKRNAPLNAPDIKTYYAGEERGYIDYPGL
ncbi:NADPH dehydrogenase [uncultured archaeon]|nr:NADPH dehydrogenase [uncultured archaeon]